ncbi:MAG: Ribosomal RNA small subunit methyltransferase B [Sodalis sp.]|nr:MAG: Ribosomal RNA small subunit methyltransferase B [Sodalis sp.]
MARYAMKTHYNLRVIAAKVAEQVLEQGQSLSACCCRRYRRPCAGALFRYYARPAAIGMDHAPAENR